jgi:predicted Zn finger-like uncharacterized protein
MNVQCPSCSTTFRVDPAKVPAGGVRARCSVCAAVFPVSVMQDAGAPAAANAPIRTAAPPPPRPAPMPPIPATPVLTPRAEVPTSPPVATPATPRPAQASSLIPPAIPGARPPQPRPGTTPLPQPVVPPRPAAGGRAVNPFLSQDPSLKARRLARALVSDMVVYHPAKRRDALKAGTVKESFKEEITKSWEEYVEQVGRELADSTPYFREALNEILGDGSQIF